MRSNVYINLVIIMIRQKTPSVTMTIFPHFPLKQFPPNRRWKYQVFSRKFFQNNFHAHTAERIFSLFYPRKEYILSFVCVLLQDNLAYPNLVVAFSLHWGFLGKGLPINCLCFFLFQVEINSCPLIPLFMLESVHSGSASRDNCGPDELHVSSFPDRFPIYAWTA